MKYRTLSIVYFSLITISISAQPNYPQTAKEASLISRDIKNFIEAFHELSTNSDTLQVLQQKYFDKATPGLNEYIRRFDLNANILKNAIQKNPNEYLKIQNFYNQITTLEQDYIKELEVYKNVLPSSIFPPTYLLVADYKGIGQASKFGQLISIEKKCVDDLEILKNMIIHELTHFQQALSMGIEKYGSTYGKKDNMLELILREGGADFVTYKLVRKNEDQFTKLKNYEKDETALWERFQKDLKNQDKDFWLNVSFEDNNKGNAIQLGYGLGYKIVKAYYDQAEDKTQALQEILMMEDTNNFLIKSGYSPH